MITLLGYVGEIGGVLVVIAAIFGLGVVAGIMFMN